MFLEDELEYVRLKRSDNIMGWLAIIFVAALVFMFAGIMNSASATGSSSAPVHRTEAVAAVPFQVNSGATLASPLDVKPILVSFNDAQTAPVGKDVAANHIGEVQTLALTLPDGDTPHSTAKLADHDIKTGALILSFALMGGSFVMLTFGGPRAGRTEDEDPNDAF